jgi:hypothetical protein
MSTSKKDDKQSVTGFTTASPGIFGLMAKNKSEPRKKKSSDNSIIDKMFDILNSKKK